MVSTSGLRAFPLLRIGGDVCFSGLRCVRTGDFANGSGLLV